MKKLITLALAALLSGMATAQTLQATASDYDHLQLSFTGTTLEVGQTTLFGQPFSTLTMGSALATLNPGEPALPMVSSLIEVPLCESFEIEVTSLTFDTTVISLPYPIAPAQPSRSKSDRSEARLVIDRQLYQSDTFTGDPLVSVESVGVARSKNLASVRFCPVRYNPVSGRLIVVKHAEVTLRFLRPDISGTQALARHASPAFAPQTLNSLPGTKELASAQTAPIHYMIVANPMFRGQLDEFVAWKQRKGFLVTVAYTDQPEVGTTASDIASYIKSFYTGATAELPAPTFLLLVGDCAQLPPHNGRWDYSNQSANQQKTDLYYATWTEGDLIPDCYYGRFSAENISQLTPQVEKTLMYEQYAFSDPSFLDRAILVAGVDQGYQGDNGYKFGDPAMDYAAREYVRADNGFTSVTYYKNNTAFAPEGVTVTGSSQASATASTLRNLYSEGAGWINYTAHGDVTEWYEPNFSNSHVSQMTNREKFGFMIGNCCLTGKFDQTCIGEALLRKDNLCGAVIYFGGSNVTYWYEDFYWSVGVRPQSSINNTMNTPYNANSLGMYDRLFHTHGEARDQWYTCAGGMMMAGNLAVQSSSSGNAAKNYYWEVYHCFGDPSVQPYLGQAPAMPVQASSTLPLGSATLGVQAAPYAYCALTDGHGTLIGAAFADAGGHASIPTSAINSPGTYELACTAQGYQPYFQEVTAFVLDGPFVKVNAVEGTLVAGEAATLTVEFENVGTEPTETLTLELIADGHHLFLTQAGQQTQQNLAAGATATATFTAEVLPTVADQTRTQVQTIVRWGRQTRQSCRSNASLVVDAPKLVVTGHTVEGTLEGGRQVELTVNVANQGHAIAEGLRANLLILEPSIRLADSMLTADTAWNLYPGQEGQSLFTLTLDSTLPADCAIPLFYRLTDGTRSTEQTLTLALGLGTMEDFESAGFTAFPWSQGQYPWEITSSQKYAGTYSARSKTWSSSYWGGGNSGNNCTSDMQMEWTSTVDDSITFYYKVSSENGYDWFYFYIDGQEKMKRSGEEDWTRAAFPVSAGTHTFRFAYTKDASQRSGSDCAWLDNITLPLNGVARHYTLDTLCQGDTYAMPTYTVTADSTGTFLLTDTTEFALYFTQLTVLPAPELTLEADHLTIRAGEHALLTAGGAQRYQWSTGETTPSLRVYPTETTTYTLIGTNGHCADTLSITITVDGTIGVVEADQPTLRLYPNPTTGEIHLDGLTGPADLYDLTGRRLMTLTAPTADLTPLPRGVYLLRAGGQVHKVIKR